MREGPIIKLAQSPSAVNPPLVWRETPKNAGKSSLRVNLVTLLLFRHRRLKPNVFCAVGVV